MKLESYFASPYISNIFIYAWMGVSLVTFGSNDALRGSGIHNYQNNRFELEEGEGRLIEGDA